MRILSSLLFAVLLSLSACGSGLKEGAREAAAVPQATVKVDNRNWLDASIYVMRGSDRIRLGMVSGLSQKLFPIPKELVFGPTTLRFLIDPVGESGTVFSQEISVSPGDEVQLLIPR